MVQLYYSTALLQYSLTTVQPYCGAFVLARWRKRAPRASRLAPERALERALERAHAPRA
jgi:hypothetical protein